MPRKAYLVGRDYVRKRLSERRGLAVATSAVQQVIERVGFPRPYYTPEQARDLALVGHFYERAMIDAFLARITDADVLMLRLDGAPAYNGMDPSEYSRLHRAARRKMPARRVLHAPLGNPSEIERVAELLRGIAPIRDDAR